MTRSTRTTDPVQQPFPVEPADVEAAALLHGGLLVEAIPAATTYAANRNLLLQLFTEIIRQVYKAVILLPTYTALI